MSSEHISARAMAAYGLSIVFVSVCSAVLLALLSALLSYLTTVFVNHSALLFGLPLVGVATYFLYKGLRVPFFLTDSDVISKAALNASGQASFKESHLRPGHVIFAIMVGTSLTIAFGGTVGAESAAFQIGSAMALCSVCPWIFRKLKATDHEHSVAEGSILLARCGMSSALGALFGTPITSALLIWEMSSRLTQKITLRKEWRDLLMMLLSAAIGALTFKLSKGDPLAWAPLSLLTPALGADPSEFAKLALLFVFAFVAALVWYYAVDHGRRAVRKFVIQTGSDAHYNFRKTLIVLVVAGVLGVGVLLLLAPFDGYEISGTGARLMSSTMDGRLINGWQATLSISAAKLFLTALLLAGMYKGGDLTPTMAIGCGLGAGIAGLLGLPITFGALVGLSVFLPVCTNCTLAAVMFCAESYGAVGLLWSIPFVALSYLLTSRISFYNNKR